MNKQIGWGIILQYAQMVLNILIHLVYTPIMIRLLGQSEYGLYNFVSSIISYLSLLSLGFGAGYIRFYSRYKAKDDRESIKKLNALYLVVFATMGVVSFVAGLVISFNCGIFFNSTYTAGDLRIAKVLMIFLTINLTASFPASVFTSYITSQEKFIFLKLINIINTVLSPCLCIAVLFLGYGSIGMVITTTIISFVTIIINVVYCFTKLKMRFKFGRPEKGLFKEIFLFSLFIAINQIIDQINYQTDKLILGKMINATAVAIYAVASTINSMYLQLSTSISSIFIPKVHQIVNSSNSDKDKDDKLTELFIQLGRIQYFILMLVLTGFIFFGEYFIVKWAGEEYKLAYTLILMLIIPSTVPLIQNIGIEIQRAKNKHQFRSVVYLIVALLNLGISIGLCKVWGIVGVVVGTVISNLIGTITIMNIYYHKKLKINIPKFWLEILKASVGLIIPAVVGAIFKLFIPINNVIVFIGLISVYTIVYVTSVYFLGANKVERLFIQKGVKKMITKLKFFVIRVFYYFASRLFCKKRAVFISFAGKEYSDNPKAVSKKLHELAPNVKQIWLFNDPKSMKKKVPDYVKCKKLSRFNNVYFIATSRVVVDNDFLTYSQFLQQINKSKKQIFIETWHGDRGIKKCFYEKDPLSITSPFALEKPGLIDYFVTGSTHMEELVRIMFRYKGEYLPVGCPRNDILFRDNTKLEHKAKQILGVSDDTKILLYAPTFRQKIPDNVDHIDLDRVVDALQKKTGKKWVVVYRTHHINHGNSLTEYFDGRKLFDDMADILCAADMLITDYSSCGADYLLSGKPMILYIDDYDSYTTKDRGTHFDLEQTPYLIAKTNDQIVDIINKLTPEMAKQNCKDVLDFYGCYENGNASEEICKIIKQSLKIK